MGIWYNLPYNYIKKGGVPMADSRKLKVYEGSGWNYKSVPEIILKGDWLKQYGFTEDTPIHVLCEDGKLTITPRDPDPIPEKIGNILSSLSEKERRILERSLQRTH